MRVVEAPKGAIAASDQLSAILIVMPMLRRQSKWAVIVRTSEKARDIANGAWVDKTLPFMKGVALCSLNRPAQAASCFEQAIELDPAFHPAYLEFDKAMTLLGKFDRCRQMAQRLVDHGGHWVSCWQRPDHFLSDPPVASRPWHDPGDFGVVSLLERHFAVIKAELEAVDAAGVTWGSVGSSHRGNENSAHDAHLVAQGEWKEVVLLGDTEKCASAARRCPETARLLGSCPEVAECAALQLGESLFSKLTPGTHLRPHCGPSNMRLTAHLALVVPEGCEITCGGETRAWEEGKCLVFDDSYEHEVRHRGGAPRTVLLVNFWHPDIPRERWAPLMRELQRKDGPKSQGPVT